MMLPVQQVSGGAARPQRPLNRRASSNSTCAAGVGPRRAGQFSDRPYNSGGCVC